MKKQDESFVTRRDKSKFDEDIEDILSSVTSKGTHRKRLLKRLSPFLLLAVLLTLWFVYTMIMGNEAIPNKWALLSLFAIALVNILFIDFALWRYFEHKKVLKIWLIEIVFSFPIIYFFDLNLCVMINVRTAQ
jgi:hypothetical protein